MIDLAASLAVFVAMWLLHVVWFRVSPPRARVQVLLLLFFAGLVILAFMLARAAAWAPNPANPPLYLDLPTKNGEVVPSVAVKWAANSPVAMLDQYVPNLKKYKAIALDIGLQDNLITSNKVLVEAMTRYGIVHTFETYEGDHGNRIPQRLEEKVLPFFSRHLK